MKSIAYYQLMFLFLMSTMCYMFFSGKIFISAMLGGVCYFMPTLIAVIFLYYMNNMSSSVIWVMYAEFMKVLFCMMFMFFMLYYNSFVMNWIWFLLGFFSVSHSMMFLFSEFNYGNS